MHFTATDWAAAAVGVDSVVTLWVGSRLTKTAKRETAKAAENVKPAIQQELSLAVVRLVPVIVQKLTEVLRPADKSDEPREVAPVVDIPQLRSERATRGDEPQRHTV